MCLRLCKLGGGAEGDERAGKGGGGWELGDWDGGRRVHGLSLSPCCGHTNRCGFLGRARAQISVG